MNTIKIKKINPKAQIPYKATEGSAGYDLRACIEDPIVLGPGEFKLIPTGLAFGLPDYIEGQIRPRSGLAAKYGITVLNSPGTIDFDFIDEVKVILINHSNKDFIINPHERIAQIVFNEVAMTEFKEVEFLDKTERLGGFGSTGVK